MVIQLDFTLCSAGEAYMGVSYTVEGVHNT